MAGHAVRQFVLAHEDLADLLLFEQACKRRALPQPRLQGLDRAEQQRVQRDERTDLAQGDRQRRPDVLPRRRVLNRGTLTRAAM